MRNYIIDIDGTLLHDNQAINQSVEFISALQKEHSDFILATNSIKSAKDQLLRLNKVGINVDINQIYSPVNAINIYIQAQNIKRAFIVANEQDQQQIQCPHDDKNCELIVLLDFEKPNIDYQQLQKIIDLAQSGVPVISASASPFYLSGNQHKIDTGAFVNLIESITGESIEIFGKPSDFYFKNALAQLNALSNTNNLNSSKSNTLIIGDDYQTDILKAKDFDLKTALVNSGKFKSGQQDLCQPDYFIEDGLLALI